MVITSLPVERGRSTLPMAETLKGQGQTQEQMKQS
jgi:hypothetical protein